MSRVTLLLRSLLTRQRYVIASGVDTAGARAEEELRRTQLELRESEANLRAIFDTAFQFIGLLSPDGTLLDANKSALDFIGATRDEIVGRPFWATPWWTHSPELQEHLRSAIEEGARGRFTRFEATHSAPDGTVITVDFSLSPVVDGQGKVVFLVPEGRDVTARVHFQREHEFLSNVGAVLATTLDYQEILVTVAKLAVRYLADWCCVDTVDEEGNPRRLAAVHRNPAKAHLTEALIGLPLDQKRPHLTWTVLETKQPLLVSRLPAGYLESVAQSDEHLRLLRELDPQSFMALPLIARGRLLGVLLIASADAGRRYADEDLRLGKELAVRAALAIENARLYSAAQRAILARDEVLAVVAHDLRNPLSTIHLSAAAALLKLPENEMGQAARRAIEAIARASRRANHLIEDLLDLARSEAGKLVLDRLPEAPRALVADAIDMAKLAAQRASLDLQVAVPADLPDVYANRERLSRVFSNLIGNAIKFTPPGGRVTVAAETRGKEVCFSVSDTGTGIPSEDLEHVFDRFWQAGRADRRGVGLGLSIARALVESHGGRIWVESAVGRGSTFSFCIPVATQLGEEPQGELHA